MATNVEMSPRTVKIEDLSRPFPQVCFFINIPSLRIEFSGIHEIVLLSIYLDMFIAFLNRLNCCVACLGCIDLAFVEVCPPNASFNVSNIRAQGQYLHLQHSCVFRLRCGFHNESFMWVKRLSECPINPWACF